LKRLIHRPERGVKRLSTHGAGANKVPAQAVSADDWRFDRLVDRLPQRIGSTIRFVRRPSARWLRIPVGLLLTLGGVLWFLPIAGLWMLPLGLALLADDFRLLRSLRSRILDWVERHRPDWLAHEARPHDRS
jgi:hypothetical protein